MLSRAHGAENTKIRALNERFPHSLFHCLLKEISYDHIVCIDWLISDETCFSSALGCYLEIVISDFNSFLRSLDETGRNPNSNLFGPHDSYIAGCFDSSYRVSGSRGVSAFHSCKFHQRVSSDDIIDLSSESRPVANELSWSNILQLGSPVIDQESRLIVCDRVHKARTGITSLVSYSSSESDDESDIDNSRTNTIEACFSTWNEHEAGEKYSRSTEKAITVECESESCSVEEKNHYVTRLDTSCPEDSYCENDSSKKTITKKSIGSRDVYIMDQMKGDSEKTGQIILMDFLIRLRLKLERIEENSLSNKDLKGLILQLNIIERRYDSLSI